MILGLEMIFYINIIKDFGRIAPQIKYYKALLMTILFIILIDLYYAFDTKNMTFFNSLNVKVACNWLHS